MILLDFLIIIFKILGMELPWYAKPAVILGKFYPEITIKKVYKEDKLPPYLPKGRNIQIVKEMVRF